MKLESIQEVTALRDQRAEAIKLRDGVWTGSLGSFEIWIDGERHTVLNTVNENYLRAAISYNAEALVDSIDNRLKELGVSMPRLERSPEPPTVESAMSELKMYQQAWIRELGPFRQKRHLIDGLVVATRELRAKADRYREDVVPKIEHDRRVTELLQHNNTMEERMRTAERKLKTFMNSTPAERLAFAVEHAAASTIAAIKQEDSLC